MKKYEKPAIEIVEVDLSRNYLIGTSTGDGYADEQFAPGKKGAPEDDDNGFETEGW